VTPTSVARPSGLAHLAGAAACASAVDDLHREGEAGGGRGGGLPFRKRMLLREVQAKAPAWRRGGGACDGLHFGRADVLAPLRRGSPLGVAYCSLMDHPSGILEISALASS
jgi:hypothetical protein